MPSENEVAWAAGLFEGEGCITMFQQKHHQQPQLRLSVQMTDRDVVERFCSIVECESVSPEKRLRPPRKPVHVWQISNRRDVERLLLMFMPWLGERRRMRADEALTVIAQSMRSCDLCGDVFRAHRSDTRFCCWQHRNRWHYLKRTGALA
jgi:hypothetical protein